MKGNMSVEHVSLALGILGHRSSMLSHEEIWYLIVSTK